MVTFCTRFHGIWSVVMFELYKSHSFHGIVACFLIIAVCDFSSLFKALFTMISSHLKR